MLFLAEGNKSGDCGLGGLSHFHCTISGNKCRSDCCGIWSENLAAAGIAVFGRDGGRRTLLLRCTLVLAMPTCWVDRTCVFSNRLGNIGCEEEVWLVVEFIKMHRAGTDVGVGLGRLPVTNATSGGSTICGPRCLTRCHIPIIYSDGRLSIH